MWTDETLYSASYINSSLRMTWIPPYYSDNILDSNGFVTCLYSLGRSGCASGREPHPEGHAPTAGSPATPSA